jgi:hypothetical protein
MKSDAAEAAIAQLADRDFMGRPVAISHAQPRASDAAGGSDSGSSGGGGRRGSSSGSRYGDGGGGRSGARGSWGGSRRDDAGSAAADVPAPRPGCKRLYVGGLNYRCTAQQLAEHLGMCGRVEVRLSVWLMGLWRSSGRRRQLRACVARAVASRSSVAFPRDVSHCVTLRDAVVITGCGHPSRRGRALARLCLC